MSHHHQHPPRRIFTPGASRKRIETESGFYSYKLPTQSSAYPASNPAFVSESVSSNRLLAGYMAYEFLTKGTLFGRMFDPARAESVPLAGRGPFPESKRAKPEAEPAGATKAPQNSYADVASIVKSAGTHIPGVFNPTQLARWTQM